MGCDLKGGLELPFFVQATFVWAENCLGIDVWVPMACALSTLSPGRTWSVSDSKQGDIPESDHSLQSMMKNELRLYACDDRASYLSDRMTLICSAVMAVAEVSTSPLLRQS